MHKSYLILLFIPFILGAAPSRTCSYVTGQTIEADCVSENEDNIFAYLQSGIDTVAAGIITSNHILDGTVANIDISSSAAIPYSKLSLSGSIVSGDITDGTITNSDIASGAAISFSKLGTLADDSTLVGNASSVPTATAIGDCQDSAGNHLNYTASSNAFSCGTSSSVSYTAANTQVASCSTSSCQATATCTANTVVVFAVDRDNSTSCSSATATTNTNMNFKFNCLGATSCTSEVSSGSAACVRISCVD